MSYIANIKGSSSPSFQLGNKKGPTIYSGTAIPDNQIGIIGDIYLQGGVNFDSSNNKTPSAFLKIQDNAWVQISYACLPLAGGTMYGSLYLAQDPQGPMEACTRQYADSLRYRLQIKSSARLLSTTNINVASPGSITIDGRVPATNDRILLIGQDNKVQNGLYNWQGTSTPMTRTIDANEDVEVTTGMYCSIDDGFNYKGQAWALITDEPIVLDTTELVFTRIYSPGQLNPQSGFIQNGNTFSIGSVNPAHIVVNSTSIDIGTAVATWGTTLSHYGITDAVKDILGTPGFMCDLFANLPDPTLTTTGVIFIAYDNYKMYRNNGSSWDQIGGGDTSNLAPLDSPSFIGIPTAPTPTATDNSLRIATTAFVQAHTYGAFAAGGLTIDSPDLTGTPTAPTATLGDNSTQIATTAFVTQGFAPINSPALTGSPTAPTPTVTDNSTAIATTSYVQSLLGDTVFGLNPKNACQALADFNINIASPGSITIDTWTPSANNRILLINQATGSQNGIWVWHSTSTPMTRATDADASAKVTNGMYTVVTEGSSYKGSSWALTTPDPINLGVTTLTFTQIRAPGVTSVNAAMPPQFSVGSAITSTGNISISWASQTPDYILTADISGTPVFAALTALQVNTALGYTAASDAVVVKTSGTQSIAGAKTFSTSIAAPTVTVTDNSTNVATTAFVKNQGYAIASSASLTGTPTAPTPTVTDNSTAIATTAWVNNQQYAPLTSPSLTGTPTAPTVTVTDNSNTIATTAFVKAAMADKYTKSFNNTTDWGSPVNGYYTISISAVTHGRGEEPMVQVQMFNGTSYNLSTPDTLEILISGDVTFSVPSSPDDRFTGRICIL